MFLPQGEMKFFFEVKPGAQKFPDFRHKNPELDLATPQTYITEATQVKDKYREFTFLSNTKLPSNDTFQNFASWLYNTVTYLVLKNVISR